MGGWGRGGGGKDGASPAFTYEPSTTTAAAPPARSGRGGRGGAAAPPTPPPNKPGGYSNGNGNGGGNGGKGHAGKTGGGGGGKGGKGGKFRKPSEDVPDALKGTAVALFADISDPAQVARLSTQLARRLGWEKPEAAAKHLVGARLPLVGRVGQGTFGKVFDVAPPTLPAGVRVQAKTNGAPGGAPARIAAKVMAPFAQYCQFDNDARREAFILEKLAAADTRGECLQYYGAFEVQAAGGTWVGAIIEALDVNLFEYFNAGGSVDVKEIARQLVAQVRVMHTMDFVHSDIKHKNIMINKAGTAAKIIDYGSGVFPGDPRPAVVVTKPFRPPEIYTRKTATWGKEIDIFALGCTIGWLAVGKRIFNADIGNIRPGVRFAFGDDGKTSRAAPAPPLQKLLIDFPGLAGLLARMMHIDPDQRCTADEAMNDPYFK